MAKKKQGDEAVRIAKAIEWIKDVLKNDPIAGANHLLSKPLRDRQEELTDELVEKTLESGKAKESRSKGGKKGSESTQNSSSALPKTQIENNARF